jgi:hypothetical protein
MNGNPASRPDEPEPASPDSGWEFGKAGFFI